MEHLILFYYITVLFILFVSYNIPVLIYIKTGDKFLKKYIIFFLPFILYTIISILQFYIHANIKLSLYPLLIALSFTSELCFVLEMVSMIYFINYLLNLKYSKIINMISSIICTFLIIIIPLQTKISIASGKLQTQPNFLSTISTYAFIIFLLYYLIFGLLSYKKISKPEIKSIVKSSLFLTLAFFPGMLYDFFQKITNAGVPNIILKNSESPKFLTHPIFYCLLSITSTYFIIKYYFKEYNIIVSKIPLDNLLRKFNISEREKEVLVHLINGKSNNEIADTLFISINTVKTHIKNIYEKLNIKSRYELISLVKSNIN